MTVRRGLVAMMLAAAQAVSASATAEDLSADEIAQRSNRVAYYQGADGRAEIHMTITDARDRERTRVFSVLRRDGDDVTGEQRLYLYFRRPADVNKVAFLVWKHPGKDDDRWLYLPALDLVKRIAATDKRTRFVGSDFFYEDVSGRDPRDDRHELLETTDSYYVLRSRPRDPGLAEFDHFDTWIHKQTFVAVRSEYFDASGERYRVYEALEVETISGHPTVTRARMSNLSSGGSTLLQYTAVAYDVGLPEEIFNERSLRRSPSQHLQ